VHVNYILWKQALAQVLIRLLGKFYPAWPAVRHIYHFLLTKYAE